MSNVETKSPVDQVAARVFADLAVGQLGVSPQPLLPAPGESSLEVLTSAQPTQTRTQELPDEIQGMMARVKIDKAYKERVERLPESTGLASNLVSRQDRRILAAQLRHAGFSAKKAREEAGLSPSIDSRVREAGKKARNELEQPQTQEVQTLVSAILPIAPAVITATEILDQPLIGNGEVSDVEVGRWSEADDAINVTHSADVIEGPVVYPAFGSGDAWESSQMVAAAPESSTRPEFSRKLKFGLALATTLAVLAACAPSDANGTSNDASLIATATHVAENIGAEQTRVTTQSEPTIPAPDVSVATVTTESEAPTPASTETAQTPISEFLSSISEWDRGGLEKSEIVREGMDSGTRLESMQNYTDLNRALFGHDSDGNPIHSTSSDFILDSGGRVVQPAFVEAVSIPQDSEGINSATAIYVVTESGDETYPESTMIAWMPDYSPTIPSEDLEATRTPQQDELVNVFITRPLNEGNHFEFGGDVLAREIDPDGNVVRTLIINSLGGVSEVTIVSDAGDAENNITRQTDAKSGETRYFEGDTPLPSLPETPEGVSLVPTRTPDGALVLTDAEGIPTFNLNDGEWRPIDRIDDSSEESELQEGFVNYTFTDSESGERINMSLPDYVASAVSLGETQPGLEYKGAPLAYARIEGEPGSRVFRVGNIDIATEGPNGFVVNSELTNESGYLGFEVGVGYTESLGGVDPETVQGNTYVYPGESYYFDGVGLLNRTFYDRLVPMSATRTQILLSTEDGKLVETAMMRIVMGHRDGDGNLVTIEMDAHHIIYQDDTKKLVADWIPPFGVQQQKSLVFSFSSNEQDLEGRREALNTDEVRFTSGNSLFELRLNGLADIGVGGVAGLSRIELPYGVLNAIDNN